MTDEQAEKFDHHFTTFLRATAEGRETLRLRYAGDAAPYRELRDLYMAFLEPYGLDAIELAFAIVVCRWRKETIPTIARVIKTAKRVASQQVYLASAEGH